MKILSGGFWLMFVIYAVVVDRALTYLPNIPGLSPYLSPAEAYGSGGLTQQGASVSFSFNPLQAGGGVIVVAALMAWFTPRLF